MIGSSSARPPVTRGVFVAGVALVCAIVVGLILLASGMWAEGQGDDPQTGADPASVGEKAPDGDSDAGREVLPQYTESREALPLVPVGGSLLSAPFAASAFAAGALVDGFPADIIGPIPGADVVETAIASGAHEMQTTLIARTDAAATDIVAHYRDLWAGLGRAASTVAGQADLAYSGAFESFTLAVRPSGGTGTIYVVTAVFRSS